MARHKDLQEIIDSGGSLDDIGTIGGCIISHNLSLDMDSDTLRARLVALPYIADIEPHIFRIVVEVLRRLEAKKADLPQKTA